MLFQRPKVEDEQNYLFITFKSLAWIDELSEIAEEQFSMILTANEVITFQENLVIISILSEKNSSTRFFDLQSIYRLFIL